MSLTLILHLTVFYIEKQWSTLYEQVKENSTKKIEQSYAIECKNIWRMREQRQEQKKKAKSVIKMKKNYKDLK